MEILIVVTIILAVCGLGLLVGALCFEKKLVRRYGSLIATPYYKIAWAITVVVVILGVIALFHNQHGA